MPLDQARWQIELAASDRTAAAFNSVTQRMRSLDQASKATGGTMSEAFSGVTRALAPLAIAYAAVAAAQKAFHIGLKAGDLGEQAEQVGVTADQLQAYRLAAAQAGIEAEQMDTALMKLAKSMGTANEGNDEMIARFEKLGVKLLDGRGELRKTADVLPELSRGLLGISSSTERTAILMQLFGRSGARMTTMLEEWAKGNERLVESAKGQDAIVGPEAIKAWDRLDNQLKVVAQQGNVTIATLGAPIATWALEQVSKLLQQINTDMERIKRDTAARESGQTAAMQDVKELEEQLATAKQAQLLTQPGSSAFRLYQASINALEKRLAAFKQASENFARENFFDRRDQATSGYNLNLPGVSQPKGDKGKGFAESGEKKLIELQAEHAAIDRALASYAAVGTESIAELDKRLAAQIALEKRIVELTINLSENDPLAKKLRNEATAISEGNIKKAEMNRLLTEAEGISKQYGDGTRELARATDGLNKLQAMGAINADTYAFALKRAKEGAADQERASRGAKDGITGYIAGLEQGFSDLDKANTQFEIGKRSIQMFDEAIAQLATGAEVNFAKILQSFLVMIVQMEARAALSSLWKLASSGGAAGGGGGLFSGFLSLLGIGGGAGAEAIAFSQADLGQFAHGGDYRAGMPRLVGENGPEIDIPRTAGTIVSQREIAAAMNGEGGGGTVVINQTLNFGSDVTQSTLKTWAEQTKQATMAAVIDARRRGGQMKAAFA